MEKKKKIKIQKVEEESNYESFQQYAHDPYLGKSMSERYIPAHDTAPVPGSTIREKWCTKFEKFGTLVRKEKV